MPKYMWQISYSREGAQGLIKEGGTGRRAMIQKMLEDAGGKLEVCYYAFGPDDLIVIGDVPDNVSVAAMSLVTAAGGAARSRTTVLLTPEEIDEAASRPMNYRAPGR